MSALPYLGGSTTSFSDQDLRSLSAIILHYNSVTFNSPLTGSDKPNSLIKATSHLRSFRPFSLRLLITPDIRSSPWGLCFWVFLLLPWWPISLQPDYRSERLRYQEMGMTIASLSTPWSVCQYGVLRSSQLPARSPHLIGGVSSWKIYTSTSSNFIDWLIPFPHSLRRYCVLVRFVHR